MTTELYAIFDWFNDDRNDRSWWPIPPENIDSIPLMTAAVRLSGRMDDCRTEDDLRKAVEHTMSLVQSGVLTTMFWAAEGEKVKTEMEEWYQHANEALTRIAGNN